MPKSPKLTGHQTSAIRFLFCALILIAIQACTTKKSQSVSKFELPAQELFSVMISGTKVGHLKVNRNGNSVNIDFDYKSNGRGPTIKESLILNPEGFPVQWDISGNTTFGNEIDEHYKIVGNNAEWIDATGKGEATINQPSLYIDQSASPYSLFINAHVLLNSTEYSAPALPAGNLKLTAMETFKSISNSKSINLKSYAMTGAGLNPTYFVLDQSNSFFAFMTPRLIVIRSGFENEEDNLRQLAERYSASRYKNLQTKYAHTYKNNLRIRNIKIFDPKALALTEMASVLIGDGKIISIDATDVKTKKHEVEIDGQGGTLVAGLYEMHGHIGVNAALLNVIAGVTSVRDMGNNNEVLGNLIDDIESGILAGPRITRLGMIEGKSPYNNNSGVLVENLDQALEAVQEYADKGFYGVKLYNSMNGDWAPTIIKKAHELNMHVTGHVPAFSNANSMLRAGYDELTHINQILLGWVLEPDEDTRTLLRLTALQRIPDLDLNSDAVNETLDLMVKNKTVLDPTLAIHEALLLGRNGATSAGRIDYIDHMPANVQRNAKVGWISIANEKEDKAYRLAYNKIIDTLKLMKERGIMMVPGTDLGGAFNLHRELELYQQLGYTPAELLKLGSYDMAQYLGHSDRGSVEPGMLADFFLVPNDPTKDIKAIKTISMVSRGGVLYFPSEIYPEFGIKPFVKKPKIINANN
jgi:imidazolonepropionase-like amidohydrolase